MIRANGAVLFLLAVLATPSMAQIWTATTAPSNFWGCVASSADGTKLVAAVGAVSCQVYPGGIYVSTNSGVAWSLTSAPTLSWASVACSADGRIIAAADHIESGIAPGSIYISTNGGTSWTVHGAYEFWRSVAISADGSKCVALASITTSVGGPRGRIYASIDSGATWTQASVPDINWSWIASSSDGTKLVATAAFDSIYSSTNQAVKWTATTAPNQAWYSASSSADGRKLVAASSSAVYNHGAIYASTNSGDTWALTSAPALDWVSVASSADGTKLVTASGDSYIHNSRGPIYTSTDSGITWTPASVPDLSWSAVASTADGCRLIAAGWTDANNGGLIYVSQASPKPVLSIAQADSSLVVSWVVPSMNFVLQQNSDLTMTNWEDVTAARNLNYANLRYEVTVPAPTGSVFYRLVSR